MQYYVAQSLDGFIADEHDGLDWLLSFGFEAFQASYDRFFAGVGAIVMGAATLRFLIASGEPWPYPSLPTWVLTHRPLPVIEGADLRPVADDPARVAAEARAAAGDRAVWVVGGGARLLPTTGGPLAWRLEGSTVVENGAVELRYSRATD